MLAAELNLTFCSPNSIEAVQDDAVGYLEQSVLGSRRRYSTEKDSQDTDAANDMNYNMHFSDSVTDLSTKNISSTFECVVIDPPNLCPTKELKQRAQQRYMKMVKLSSLLATHYLVVTCCSPYISLDDLVSCVTAGLEKSRRSMEARIVHQSYCQDADFPVNVHVSTTRHLKAVIVAFVPP